MYLTLFGTPSGFSARTYGRPPFEVDDRWIDSRNEVPLDDGEWAALVSRRQCAQGLLTWIGLYRPAHEIHVSRGGQYGAGLWLLNQAAPGPEAFALLTAVADEVARLALANGKFTRTIDAFEPEIRWPDALGAAVRKALRPATQAGVGTGDKPMLLMDASAPDDTAACGVLIDLAQGGAGLGGYQRMLITALPRVARQAMAFSHAAVTTPAKWQQGVEAVVDAAARRTREELQAALADAESVRKGMAAMRERLLADHDEAMAAQSARLTAEFGQQLQQAKARIGQLEPALQQARQDLESVRVGARKAEDACALLKLVVQDLQADASVGFQAAHAVKIAEFEEYAQALRARHAALVADLADRSHRLSRQEQDNQSLRREADLLRQQVQDDAARHRRETQDLRQALETRIEQLQSELRRGQGDLDTARRSIDELQQEAHLLRQQLQLAEPAPVALFQQHHPALPASEVDESPVPRKSPSGVPASLWASPKALVIASLLVVLVACVVLIAWPGKANLQGGASRSPVGQVTAAPAPVAAQGPECGAAWQPGLVLASPTISAPPNQHPGLIAEAVLQAACNPRRLADCSAFDQREIARQLDRSFPTPGAARWTFNVNLPQGCQLAADSTWEWSNRGLVARRVYAEPPAAVRRDAAPSAPSADKHAKANGNKAAKTTAEEAKGGKAKAEAPKAGASTGVAAASKAGAAGMPVAAKASAAGGASAPGTAKADTKPPTPDKPPAPDKPATVSAPVVSGGVNGEPGF